MDNFMLGFTLSCNLVLLAIFGLAYYKLKASPKISLPAKATKLVVTYLYSEVTASWDIISADIVDDEEIQK